MTTAGFHCRSFFLYTELMSSQVTSQKAAASRAYVESHYLDMLPLGPEPLLYEPEPAKEVSNETRAVEYILSAKESESASDYTMGAIELAREISP